MWIAYHSVEDEAKPYSDSIVRVEINSLVMYFKPNKRINGYTIIQDSEIAYGGSIPNIL